MFKIIYTCMCVYVYISLYLTTVFLNVMFTGSHPCVTVSHYRDPLHVNILIVKKFRLLWKMCQMKCHISKCEEVKLLIQKLW